MFRRFLRFSSSPSVTRRLAAVSFVVPSSFCCVSVAHCATRNTSTFTSTSNKNNNLALNNNTTTSTHMSTELTFDVLSHQDDITSRLVIELLKDDAAFGGLSEREGTGLVQRDQEDEDKLAKGIAISVKKGVLKAHPDVSPTQQINVLGKSADQVAAEILGRLPQGGETSVLILQGLSGTGKGTTVAKLKKLLPNCVTWSNGNVFRAATHMVNEALGDNFSVDNITPDLLKACFDRLSFKPFGDQFDVVIDDTVRVHDICNTTLKAPLVSSRVPTVAELTQGEVVIFAASAIETLKTHGHNVILEGRAQTLNHIPTPHRFELVIPEVKILGARRAAQRVMAFALEKLKAKGESATPAEIKDACIEAANTLK